MKLLLWLLKRKSVSQKNRAEILNFLLESVEGIPFKDIITYNDDGTIRVGDKDLTAEQLIQLREGAVALEKNWTYRTIKEQIAFNAVKLGVHQSTQMDALLMSKAALWIQNQEIELIKNLTNK